jgi:hypothetical protein
LPPIAVKRSRRYELVGGKKRFIDRRAIQKIYEFKNAERVSGKIVLGEDEEGQPVRDLWKLVDSGNPLRTNNFRYAFDKSHRASALCHRQTSSPLADLG